MKIGLFGGSFDPIHAGHLIIAQYVKNELNLDKVIFIPSAIPPHKKVYSSADIRLEMVKLSIASNPDFDCSDIEINRPAVSYSINTIKEFLKLSNVTTDTIYWILGADNLIEFHKWKDPDAILDLCNVVVFPRNKITIEAVKNKYKNKVLYLNNAPLIDISSTYIRSLIRKKKSIRYLVPSVIEQMIIDRNLYG